MPEGMTGVAVVLGGDRNLNETFMQAAGAGHSIRTHQLRYAIAQSSSLHASLLRYVQAFLEQTTRTAVSNGRAKIEERLARWLLLADDRIDGSHLPLTHDFLAMMLSVRRPGVTTALQALEGQGVIMRKRRHINIVDREALENMSNGTYVRGDM
jgi:CRP-like cAMP-binding protein